MTQTTDVAGPAVRRSVVEFGWMAPLWAMAELFHLFANPSDLAELLVSGFSVATVLAWASAVTAAVILAGPQAGLQAELQAEQKGSTASKSVPPTGRDDRPLLLLCCLVIADIVVSAPVIGNHQMILGLGSLLVIGSAIEARLRSTARAPSAPSLTGAVSVGLRWLLLIVYGAIAFSKVNTDYLNPVVSCAVVFSDELLSWFGLSASGNPVASWAAIYGSLGIELAVPLLLAVARLRSFGVVLAVVFHGLLSLEPVGHVFDFTAVLIPFFVLFAPPCSHRRLMMLINRVQRRLSVPIAVGLVVVGLLVSLILVGVGFPAWSIGYPIWIAYLIAISWAVVAPIVFGRGRSHHRTGPQSPPALLLSGNRLGPAAVVVLALALVNGAAPYLQIKTATAFNMYSNLRVIGHQTNHLIVPVGPTLRTPELVVVEAAAAGGQSDSPLDFYIERGLGVPVDNLSTYLIDSGGDTSPVVVRPVDVGQHDFGLGVPVPFDPASTTAHGSRFDPLSSSVGRSFGSWRSVDVDGPAQCLRWWGPAY